MTPENFSLSASIQALVQGILLYESDTFSASNENLNLQKAEMMAALMIQEHLFSLNGMPMSLDGNNVGYAMDMVEQFLEDNRDQS